MNRLLVLLALVPLALASTPACDAYIECEQAVEAAFSSCDVKKSAGPCGESVASDQGKLDELIKKRDSEFNSCVSSRAASATELNAKPKRKSQCTNVVTAFKARQAPKDAKGKGCLKQARKLRGQCQRLAGCCSVSKECRKQQELGKLIRQARQDVKKKLVACRKSRKH